MTDIEWYDPRDIDEEYRQEIRRRVSWSAVLTTLGIAHKPNTNGRIYIRCLHHVEKTPSMLFWPNGSYLCFGCHTGGDVAAFVFRHLQGTLVPGPVLKVEMDAFLKSCAPPVPDSQLRLPFT